RRAARAIRRDRHRYAATRRGHPAFRPSRGVRPLRRRGVRTSRVRRRGRRPPRRDGGSPAPAPRRGYRTCVVNDRVFATPLSVSVIVPRIVLPFALFGTFHEQAAFRLFTEPPPAGDF